MSRRRRKLRRRSSFSRVIAGFLLLGLMFALLLGFQAAAAIMRDLPRLDEENLLELGQTSRIYAADGSLLAEIYATENRTVVPLDVIPPRLRQATIAIEDERFYEHGGIDYEAIGRALVTDISQGALAEGGSTITQQLIKNVYMSGERSFSRKFVEAVLATELEKKVSKDVILERYLNTIYYGEGAYGIEAAAQTYFGKPAAQLDLSESALLAGLPMSPSVFSPRQNLEAAVDRRNVVLQKMADLGYVSQDEAKAATQLPVTVNTENSTPVAEPYFVEYVKQQLIDKYGAKKVFEGGLRVHTTIEPSLQASGIEAIRDTLYDPADPPAALVAIDPATGYIKAMVSSQDFQQSKFNLAVQGKRQPGSTFKPFVLTAAVEKGANPKKTYYMSKEIDIPMPGGGQPWHVATYDHKYYGPSTLEQGMLRSDNTVYAQLVMDVGADATREMARRLGITSEISANPSIALGGLGQGVSPLEMASAYGTLAAGGLYAEPIAITRVEMPGGSIDYLASPQPRKVISDGVAYEVTSVLKADIEKGTSSRANIGRPAAGKTGSTENLQDAWFVGYTPDFATAVWIGYPDAHIPMTDVHGTSVWGGGLPATIWRDFMLDASEEKPSRDFSQPRERVNFQKLTGTYVLYSGGDAPTPRTDAYGNTITTPDGQPPSDEQE